MSEGQFEVANSDGQGMHWRDQADQDWSALELGYAAQVFDAGLSGVTTNSRLLAAGVLNLVGLRVRESRTVSEVDYYLAGLGATLTTAENLIGLFNSSGALLGSSADQTANWASPGTTGYKTAALTAQSAGSLALRAGMYWVGFLAVGTTMPSLGSAGGVGSSWSNGKAAVSACRSCTNGSGLTALANFTPSASTAASNIWWAAIV